MPSADYDKKVVSCYSQASGMASQVGPTSGNATFALDVKCKYFIKRLFQIFGRSFVPTLDLIDFNKTFKITQPKSLSKLAVLMRTTKGITLTKMKNIQFCAQPMVTQPQKSPFSELTVSKFQ